jgi:hypothetical protein
MLGRLVLAGPSVLVSRIDLDLWTKTRHAPVPPLGDQRPEQEADCESGGEPNPKR